MFCVGATVGIHLHSHTDTVPLGQGGLTADGAHDVEDDDDSV